MTGWNDFGRPGVQLLMSCLSPNAERLKCIMDDRLRVLFNSEARTIISSRKPRLQIASDPDGGARCAAVGYSARGGGERRTTQEAWNQQVDIACRSVVTVQRDVTV